MISVDLRVTVEVIEPDKKAGARANGPGHRLSMKIESGRNVMNLKVLRCGSFFAELLLRRLGQCRPC